MQVAQKRVISGAAPSRARCVRVCARQQGSVSQAAAAIAAAVVLQVSPALAGVVLEQPSLKKVFQDDGRPAAAAAAAPKAAAKKKEAYSESSGGIAPQSIALPAALVVVGGGAFALTSVDAGFAEFMRTAAVKDSSEDGAGYETAIKGDGALALSKPKKSGTAKAKKGGK